MSLKCCWNWLVFRMRSHTSFFSTTPLSLATPTAATYRIMRFTHHMRAMKFNSEYRVAERLVLGLGG